jgi:hypothetical protein
MYGRSALFALNVTAASSTHNDLAPIILALCWFGGQHETHSKKIAFSPR